MCIYLNLMILIKIIRGFIRVKQVMIQKKLLAVVTSLKPIIVVWRTV